MKSTSSGGYDVIALAANAAKITICRNQEQMNFAANLLIIVLQLAKFVQPTEKMPLRIEIMGVATNLSQLFFKNKTAFLCKTKGRFFYAMILKNQPNSQIQNEPKKITDWYSNFR